MMKNTICIFSLIITAFLITCCNIEKVSKNPLINEEHTPTLNITRTVGVNSSQPTSTRTQIPITLQPSPSGQVSILNSDQIEKTLASYLMNPETKTQKVFFDAIPGKTTVNEIDNNLSYLNLQEIKNVNLGNGTIITSYTIKSGLSVQINYHIINNIVESLRIRILPNKDVNGSTSEWMFFSPEVLIQQYGEPSRIDFILDWGPNSLFEMKMFFDKEKLIVKYVGFDVIPRNIESKAICPLQIQFDEIDVWMGKNPVGAPETAGVSIEDATGLTINQFSDLLKRKQMNACILLDRNKFPIE
jgi:hypothetical protein